MSGWLFSRSNCLQLRIRWRLSALLLCLPSRCPILPHPFANRFLLSRRHRLALAYQRWRLLLRSLGLRARHIRGGLGSPAASTGRGRASPASQIWEGALEIANLFLELGKARACAQLSESFHIHRHSKIVRRRRPAKQAKLKNDRVRNCLEYGTCHPLEVDRPPPCFNLVGREASSIVETSFSRTPTKV